ncbi:hypothetical protein [Leeuwenhoekiella nanhaiensis]|uniref:Lipoprotein n=1 Tax=Leeuwenhoekiella nanhaiensis TaxID=1655491 RepID=A0A2G1VSX8_9FLAO|nr:hypothetical protein [Leeuwenhoekiella nanhaiensis]PHQ29700.1 hypothetical protein CJ305_06910 [Leeuwenhoekiella nanhaiensis]
MSINYRNLCFLLLVSFIVVTSCRAQNNASGSHYVDSLVVNVSNKIIQDYILKDFKISNQILEVTSYNSDKWYKITDEFHLGLIKPLHLSKTNDIIDFNEIYSQDYLLEKEKVSHKISKWSIISPNLDFNESEENDLIFISLPVIDSSEMYAMFYIETKYSGDLVVYKKQYKNYWEFYAIGNIWIE